ncbi:hypothetical protein VPH35_040185 [Triticum aestivum]|uniref:non-specific serine/threonine protein kinase n=1 Tax=Aegilops tauschii TaxID=37682 RepID=N1QWX3_AEGTA
MFDSGGDVTDGETLVSAGGAFTMGFFSLGVPARRYLGIWFSVSEDAVCWVANRDSPLTGTSGVLVLGNAGRLLLMDRGQRRPPVAVVRPSVEHLAARHEDRQEPVDGGRVVHHVVALSHRPVSRPLPKALPENALWHDGVNKYRTGPWNGVHFNGVAEMASYADMFSYQVTVSPGEVTYAYHAKAGAPFSRVVVTDAGAIQRLVWDTSSRAWKTFYFFKRRMTSGLCI